MGQDHIRYDVLAQDALRGVIRKVLGEVVKTGLPGEHHFFITFATGAPGVRISSRLREKYPDLMTIVVQHQYWDLRVTESTFEVGLSFSDIPERLLVPFSAIRGFYDPSVNFELEFDVRGVEAGADESADQGPKADAARPAAAPTPLPASRLPGEHGSEEPSEPETGDTDGEGRKAEVVSLDAFRKKS